MTYISYYNVNFYTKMSLSTLNQGTRWKRVASRSGRFTLHTHLLQPTWWPYPEPALQTQHCLLTRRFIGVEQMWMLGFWLHMWWRLGSTHGPTDRSRDLVSYSRCTHNVRIIVTRSRNHCCRAKTLSIAYSGCVSVALVTQHAMHIHHIAIWGLPRSTTFSHIIS